VRILIGTRNRSVGGFLKRELEVDGYSVTVAEGVQEILRVVENRACDFLIIDTRLFEPGPIEDLRGIRDADDGLPILALSEGERVRDRVLALDAGADDCMAMPLAYRELAARVRALSRRCRPLRFAEVTLGDLVLDVLNGVVRCGNRAVRLTRTELLILEQLMMARGRPVSRKKLIGTAFQGRLAEGSNAVDVYVSYLRKKIAQTWRGGTIRSVRGVGYRIDSA